MVAHCIQADSQFFGDVFWCFMSAEKNQHFPFTLGKR